MASAGRTADATIEISKAWDSPERQKVAQVKDWLEVRIRAFKVLGFSPA